MTGPIGFDRTILVKAMAADLRRLGSLGSEPDAIRALQSQPYRFADVQALAPDALYAARLAAVATEMAR